VTGQQDGGLANSSGNSGQVGPTDSVSVGSDGVNNVANPHADGVLGQALGPIVHQNLSDALKTLGDWAGADVPAGGGNADDGQETILGPGEVGEMDSTSVKNIPLDQAPQQLKNAMGGDVLKGMGH
jgi:hypothetical protein